MFDDELNNRQANFMSELASREVAVAVALIALAFILLIVWSAAGGRNDEKRPALGKHRAASG